MKRVLSAMTGVLLTASLAPAAVTGAPDPAGPRSIAELATLSNILIQRYDCTADIIIATGTQEAKFTILPSAKGDQAPPQTLQIQGDKLIASANSQMLSLEWTRAGHALATVKTMIQDSPMHSYMMMAIDPSNPEQQTQVYCNAVTFADAKAPAAVAK